MLTVVLILLMAGCQNQTTPSSSAAPEEPSSSSVENSTPAPSETSPPAESRVLVVYFSATGNTEQIAGWVAEETAGALHQIVPEVPYTSEDLNYGNSSSRATTDQNDSSARPAIAGSVDGMESYDMIYLGYPIWWGQAPRIISTFLESCDFSGKTIVPFCTSNSSGIGSSDTNLHGFCDASANWLPGERFAASASEESVKAWVRSLNIQTGSAQNFGVFNFETKNGSAEQWLRNTHFGIGHIRSFR